MEGNKNDTDIPNIDFLDCLGTIKIRPGDTVVFRINKPLDKEKRESIKIIAGLLQSQYKCKMLILDDAVDIGVLKSDG